MERERIYIAIDLKSFYASVECVERGLDPLRTNLVVADKERTEKTICLAVTPALKAWGIPGRARLFEVVSRVNEINAGRPLADSDGEGSWDADEITADPTKKLGYIIAPPRMALYMEYSTRIYNIYLKYVAPESIHVYSVDEVFIDATPYLHAFYGDPHKMTMTMVRDVLKSTGITATAGIGTNLYLAKIAMDIVAKHMPADADGVRIAELNEMSYRKQLWTHTPLTDFWRVGGGYVKKLKKMGIECMGDIARCSLGRPDEYFNEDLLYKAFGVNAELLIDHAWGWEPSTIDDIKAYRPKDSSICSGQVLTEPYTFDKAEIVIQEMADSVSLELTQKGLLTDQIVLTVGYDISNMADYTGASKCDHYGRTVPLPAHGTENIGEFTASSHKIIETTVALFRRIVDPNLFIRRMTITANHTIRSEEAPCEQMNLFDLMEEPEQDERDVKLQEAMLDVRHKYGKNAVLKGLSLEEGATAMSRNRQIGGHKA